jgi:fructan beta-fructosidase
MEMTPRYGFCIIGRWVGPLAVGLFGTMLTATPEKALAGEPLYQETYRPQFHFTARKNWLNDPNGLVYYQGEYHLFFQHNPEGLAWGNMTWGHAVSADLLHWRQLDNALAPDRLGTIFSGSAVVDWDNTAGFQTGAEKVLVCIYTSAGKPFIQSIAYSNDRGRTWKKYDKNPVLPHIGAENRDPKVFWHAPTKRWIMALYLDRQNYALFASPNLKEWTKLSDVPSPGGSECPDLFELPVEGHPDETRWVFWAGNGKYLLGRFDGKVFTKESGPYLSDWGANFYAAQTYSDIPKADGRRIQIAWMRGGQYPGMPFNQQMSFPCELTLRQCAEGLRLCRNPVREIEKLRVREHRWKDRTLGPGEKSLHAAVGDLLDVRVKFEPGNAADVALKVRGETIRYDAKKKAVHCRGKKADLEPIDGRIQLQVLVDQTSLELFGNAGQRCFSFCVPLDPKQIDLELSANGGAAKVSSLDVYELRSVWGRAR